jgi:thioredoxin-dependent peroxiredoxin
MPQLYEGMKAPDFKGIDQNGKEVALSDFAGKKLILYFYPRDNTPGCTAEACNLRDNYDELIKEGFEVVGVSADNEKSHEKFASKHSLPFPLIADTTKKIMDDYGVFGEKKLYGKSFLGVNRMTFIINGEGIIEKIIKKVQTKDHSQQIFKLFNA